MTRLKIAGSSYSLPLDVLVETELLNQALPIDQQVTSESMERLFSKSFAAVRSEAGQNPSKSFSRLQVTEPLLAQVLESHGLDFNRSGQQMYNSLVFSRATVGEALAEFDFKYDPFSSILDKETLENEVRTRLSEIRGEL